MIPLDPPTGGKVPGKCLYFQRYFFLKMTFWNAHITFFTLTNLYQCRKETLLFGILNFVIAKDFFEVSSSGNFTLCGISALR